MIKHAAAAERIWFQRHWCKLDENECDGYSRRDEGTFDLDDTIDLPDAEGVVTMRWTLLLMIQEFARHAGHGDILREQIDAAGSTATPLS